MKYLVLLLVVLSFATGCECKASNMPDEECLTLSRIMKDPIMKGSVICKLMENFCTFTSREKSIKGKMNYSHTHQIPCHQFEKYKAIQECTLEYRKVTPNSKRYSITRKCILLRTSQIKK